MTVQVSPTQDLHPVLFSQEDIETIRDAYCKEATPSEFKIFMYTCDKTRLNPLLKQIYFMKNKGGRMSIITGIDGYRLLAERTGKYMPGSDTVFKYDTHGNLISATAYVKKLGPDKQWHEIAATAILGEYRGQGVWMSKPHVMLAKVAESLAIRRAFPADLSGIYTKEEMDSEIDVTPTQNQTPCMGEVKKLDPPIEAISSEMADQIERDIDLLISPMDSEYKGKALKIYKVESFDHLTYEAASRLRKNMNMKIDTLRKKEIETPAIEVSKEVEDFDSIPF